MVAILVYAAIAKNPQKIASVRWLLQERDRDRFYQSVCCRHLDLQVDNGVHGCVQVGANGPG